MDESEAVARMLTVLADPNLLGSSTSEKIRKSGISKDAWYRNRSDARFLAQITGACTRALDEYTGSVLEALAESAQAPGRSGHADRRLFLQLVGHDLSFAKKKEGEKGKESVDRTYSDKEMVQSSMEYYRGKEDELPPGIKRILGLDPNVPEKMLPVLRERFGLDAAKVEAYVADYRRRQAAMRQVYGEQPEKKPRTAGPAVAA